MSLYLSPLLNILLVLAFITDRLFRLRSIKEYKEAKEAQIELLKQQLELERNNNDVQLAEMHKKRYENLKMILDEKELELNNNRYWSCKQPCRITRKRAH
jgi:predicted oxidoreductase